MDCLWRFSSARVPKVQEPIAEAIDQLLRYSEQRESSGEGVPALFYYNQFIVATCGQLAKFGTITTHTERHFYRWSDPWPLTLDEVAKQTSKEGAAGSPSDQARLAGGDVRASKPALAAPVIYDLQHR